MAHTVTLEEILRALETEIVLSSSYSAKKRNAKDFKYNVAQNVYVVRFLDNENKIVESDSFNNIHKAIEKYNSYNA